MNAERAVDFDCAGDRLVGILHPGSSDSDIGVIIVVGGPQYRVGSHRQFVLMARRLAAAGLPVLRFDFRGMGDAGGVPRSFEDVDEDIRAAADCFERSLPNVRKLVLLGLCDAASACLMYCRRDPRIAGLILINPWVRTEQTEARTYLRHYYRQRVFQKGLWQKLFSGRVDLSRSLKELVTSIHTARGRMSGRLSASQTHFVERMLAGLSSFAKPVLIVLSGRDLVAREFSDLCAGEHDWQVALGAHGTRIEHFPDADHTFSTAVHLDTLSKRCVEWLLQDVAAAPGTGSSSNVGDPARRDAVKGDARCGCG